MVDVKPAREGKKRTLAELREEAGKIIAAAFDRVTNGDPKAHRKAQHLLRHLQNSLTHDPYPPFEEFKRSQEADFFIQLIQSSSTRVYLDEKVLAISSLMEAHSAQELTVNQNLRLQESIKWHSRDFTTRNDQLLRRFESASEEHMFEKHKPARAGMRQFVSDLQSVLTPDQFSAVEIVFAAGHLLTPDEPGR